MVIYMNIASDDWIEPYFNAVPSLLAEYGALPLASSRSVHVLEGDVAAPDRVAVIRFPSRDHITRFMADPRYQQYRALRESGSTADILVFDDESIEGTLS
jgi:uncharacterized protein (DUF1330 family)